MLSQWPWPSRGLVPGLWPSRMGTSFMEQCVNTSCICPTLHGAGMLMVPLSQVGQARLGPRQTENPERLDATQQTHGKHQFLLFVWCQNEYIVIHEGCIINSSPPDKMVAISEMPFSNTFSWIKTCVFWFDFHWSLCLRVPLTINH